MLLNCGIGEDSQESSPTPQFTSISSSVLSFLHSPTLTSIQYHWKNHSLTRQTFVGFPSIQYQCDRVTPGGAPVPTWGTFKALLAGNLSPCVLPTLASGVREEPLCTHQPPRTFPAFSRCVSPARHTTTTFLLNSS